MVTEAVLTAVRMASQTSKLLRREEVAEGTMAFHFEKPSGFKFKAGQFVDVTLIERRLAYEAADCGLLSPDLASSIRRAEGR